MVEDGLAEYDVIVIGAGPGGEVVAGRCAGSGLSTTVVERELAGGECSFWGCMPSKGLLRPGGALAAARRAPGARQAITGAIDAGAALAWRDEIVSNWDDKYQIKWLVDNDVAVVRGHGRLTGDRTVEVDTPDQGTRALTARRAVVLATGSTAAVPPIDGLRDIHIWNNRDVTAAKEVPRRLLVLGGGAVGVEMAQAWRTLGAEEVTVVEALDRLVPGEEPFAGEELKASFEAQGISVVTSVRMIAARREGHDGPVVATLEDSREITADEILVAVGRRPNTGDLGLEKVGLEPGRSVDVDDHMLATALSGGWLYAIGDLNGRALLTHMSKYQARTAAAHILGEETATASGAIPRIVFTDPQIAAVGLTEKQAGEDGIGVRTASCELNEVAGATVTGEGVTGGVSLVIDEAREVLVGATFVGPDVGELLHAATIAIAGEVPLDRLRHAVACFPSISEVWLKAQENYEAATGSGRKS